MIKLSGVKKVYNPKKSNEFCALRDINLNIEQGELVAVVGKSGSGKSTLLNIIGFLDSCTSGDYQFCGKKCGNLTDNKTSKIRSSEIGFVKQDFALIEDYTVLDNVMLPLYFSHAADKINKATAALKSLGILELKNKQVNQLSGGQKQRVAIARAIVTNPKVILADEPTGALDSKTSAEIMGLFLELNNQGKTVVIITHDLNIAEQCKRVVQISDGRII